jgi:hypothetical protein
VSNPAYDFSAAYERIQLVTGAATQVALAAVLGVKQPSIWDAQKRESIPASWLVVLVEKYGISPDWIKTGQGQKRLARPLGEIPLEELMAELGRRQDVIYRLCAGSGVTAARVEV